MSHAVSRLPVLQPERLITPQSRCTGGAEASQCRQVAAPGLLWGRMVPCARKSLSFHLCISVALVIGLCGDRNRGSVHGSDCILMCDCECSGNREEKAILGRLEAMGEIWAEAAAYCRVRK